MTDKYQALNDYIDFQKRRYSKSKKQRNKTHKEDYKKKRRLLDEIDKENY